MPLGSADPGRDADWGFPDVVPPEAEDAQEPVPTGLPPEHPAARWHDDVPAPSARVPLVLPDAPDAPLPPLEDGRRARAVDEPVRVSPLRALAGAGLAVAGVALGVGALLTVTGSPDARVLQARPGGAAEGAAQSERLAPDALAPDELAAGELPPEEPPVEELAPEDVAPAVEPTPAPPAAPATAPAAAAAPVAAAPPPAAAPQRPARPPVAVLNNSTRTGLAERASARFARNGWPVSLTGNFRGRLRATTVYYEPGQRAAAQRFAGTFRGIARVLPRPANIPGPRGLVVVLTRDFPA